MFNREVCAQYIQSSWQGSCHMWTVVVVWQLDNYICNQCMSPLTLWVRILLRWGVLYTSYVIKFFSHLQHVSGFLRVLRFPPPIKLVDTIYLKKSLKISKEQSEILLRLALNTINLNQTKPVVICIIMFNCNGSKASNNSIT